MSQRGFEFIRTGTGQEHFFHASSIDGVHFEELQIG
jgi:cold shock CspA family protein